MIDFVFVDVGFGDVEDDDFDVIELYDFLFLDYCYLDWELSWLVFNQCVLEFVEDLLLLEFEWVNFLVIFVSNFDEFFMVCVVGFKCCIMMGFVVLINIGCFFVDVFVDILCEVYVLQLCYVDVWIMFVCFVLVEFGIEIIDWLEFIDDECVVLFEYFGVQVFFVLMLLVVDLVYFFFYIFGLLLNFVICICNVCIGCQEFVCFKVLFMLLCFVEVLFIGEIKCFLCLEELIVNYFGDLFFGMEVFDYYVFCFICNEDVEIEEDESENFIQVFEVELLCWWFGLLICFEIIDDMDDVIMDFLVCEFDIIDLEVYCFFGLFDFCGFFDLLCIDWLDLWYLFYLLMIVVVFQLVGLSNCVDIFKVICKFDVFVYYLYELFIMSVQVFFEQVVCDLYVFVIKQILYCILGDSLVVQVLIDVVEVGKQVLVLVEVKVWFDEVNNIVWVCKLEKVGVYVVYGLVGLKIYCKFVFVICEEDGMFCYYFYVGIGNYNLKISCIYEDFGLFIVDVQVGKDLMCFFNEFSGYVIEKKFKCFFVVLLYFCKGFICQIDVEWKNVEVGIFVYICIKVNLMVDEEIIDVLYCVSVVGVKVDVWVCGICSFCIDFDGISENIMVCSIFGWYFEYLCIFVFENGGDFQVYIGSVDMMYCNFDCCVEVLVCVIDFVYLKEFSMFFDLVMDDGILLWYFGFVGVWMCYVVDVDGKLLIDLQDKIMGLIQWCCCVWVV